MINTQQIEDLEYKLQALTTQLDNSHSLEECTYLWVEITRLEGQLKLQLKT